MSDLIRAIEFATVAHAGQMRKYTGEPYITHPLAVMEIVRNVPGHTEAMLVGAVLHDVWEDTDVHLFEICREFGTDVGDIVYWCSEISMPHHGNRETRKAMDAQHYAQGDWQSQTVKVADMIHNTASISEHDPDFWQVYRHEKRRILDLLTLADPGLWARADYILNQRWDS